ncbi:hypothetical protein M758_2G133600 [Ceratodon purpureus]|nr:hypothetical protein M758_2G133600 [Ceratodon purpureus]
MAATMAICSQSGLQLRSFRRGESYVQRWGSFSGHVRSHVVRQRGQYGRMVVVRSGLQLRSSRRVVAYLQRGGLCSAHVRSHGGGMQRGQYGRLLVRSSGDVSGGFEMDGSSQGEDGSDVVEEERCRVSSSQSMSELGVGLTALALVLPAIITAQASAKVAGKAKKKAKVPKAVPTMELEERKEWVKGLPRIEETIPYTEVLELRDADKLKHIIKHPNSRLKERPERVFVVLDDDRVVRCVLPPPDRDEQFWTSWENMELNSILIDAFSPAIPIPKVEGWAAKGPSLTFIWKIQEWLSKPKSTPSQGTKAKSSTSARLEELARTRREMEEERKEQEAEARRTEAQSVKDMKLARAQAQRQREEEQRMRKKEEKWARDAEKRELRMQQQAQDSADWSNFFYNASRNEGFRFLMGVFFFWLFYQTVVVGVKKRKQDYEDRLKIEKAEEEDRKKMREWEGEMEAAEALSTSQDWGKEGMSEEEKKRLEEVENNPQLKMGMKFMKSGARVRRAKGRRPPQFLDLDADVKFADVAGLGDIRKELEEIVDFFTYGEKYRRRGSKIPAGILLCGEPGTGKTLLAKAVAGEAGVNFFSISASQFVEIYVGVGASRVRALYNEARENAPAVVFIDELDAVGRQRGLIGGSGGQERDSTLNQLLTCLDGFEGKGEVITIAATNRADILDTALVRPGRFDRKIYIPKPGTKGRAEILRVHARNKPMAEEVDYDAVAEMTDGMVGAQLANILDVAALGVMRDRRSEITTDDMLEAAQLEEGGHPDPRPRSDYLLWMLALNEASMAAFAANCPDLKQIQLVTIIPRMGEEKGAVRFKTDRTKFELQSVSRQGMLDYIAVQLAPRAADEIWNGVDNMSTIWADTVDQARAAARDFVYAGLSDKGDLYGLHDCVYNYESVKSVDVEALKVVNQCYDRALEFLKRNQTLVNKLVEILVKDRVIRQVEFAQLVATYGNLDPPPPTPMEVRNRSLAAFQESMIADKRSIRK